MYTISYAHRARVVLLPWSIYTAGRRLSYSPRPASSRVYLWQVTTNCRPTVTAGCPPDWQSWTRVPGFGGRQTSKPGFEKYRPGLHSLIDSHKVSSWKDVHQCCFRRYVPHVAGEIRNVMLFSLFTLAHVTDEKINISTSCWCEPNKMVTSCKMLSRYWAVITAKECRK